MLHGASAATTSALGTATEAAGLAGAGAESRGLARDDLACRRDACLRPRRGVRGAEPSGGLSGVELGAWLKAGVVPAHHVPERSVAGGSGGVVAAVLVDDHVVLVDAVDHVIGLACATTTQESRRREDDNCGCCDSAGCA